MSKRRNRSGAPNIPKETLDRARKQAAVDRGETVEEEAEEVEAAEQEEVEAAPESAPEAAPVALKPAAKSAGTPASASAARRAEAARRAAARSRSGARVSTTRKPKDRDHSAVASMLLHPTRFVSEEQLREEYGYVASDLKGMVAVTIAMVVILLALAFVLPK